MKKLSLNETARLLLEKDNYILISHRRPDGDTCGSCAATAASSAANRAL